MKKEDCIFCKIANDIHKPGSITNKPSYGGRFKN